MKRSHVLALPVTVLVFTLVLPVAFAAAAAAQPASADADLAAARTLFEANIQAIRNRDRDAYLACYLQSPGLARTSPAGFALGFEDFAASTGEAWPDAIEALDLRLTPVEPGVVYGTYRYRVRYGADEQSGLSERLFVKRPEGWKIAVTTAFPAPPGTPPPPRALVGATLVDGTGAPPVADAVVLLRDGRIECAGPRAACPVPAGVETLDLAGHFVTPGLVDAHVHFSQTGWADGRPDALDLRDLHPYERVQAELRERPERFLRSQLCSGVTAVFDVGGYPWTLELSERAAQANALPHVAAAGPLLSTLDFWLNLPGERQFLYLADAEAARTGARYLAALRADAIKVWFIPTRERPFDEMATAVQAAGEEAKRLGLPLIVHATGLAEAKAALRAGARLLVHSVWDQPVDQEFIDLALAGKAVYCPTLTVGRGYLRLFEGVVAAKAPEIDDPNGCVDPGTLARVAETARVTPKPGTPQLGAEQLEARRKAVAERERIAAANLKRLWEVGVPIAMGTDAGNPLTLHGPSVYAEMEAMQAAGMPPLAVLRASTQGGALAMGRQDVFGTAEKGKAADLLVVAADPTKDIANLRRVRWVVRGGVARGIDELKALASGGPPPAAEE